MTNIAVINGNIIQSIKSMTKKYINLLWYWQVTKRNIQKWLIFIWIWNTFFVKLLAVSWKTRWQANRVLTQRGLLRARNFVPVVFHWVTVASLRKMKTKKTFFFLGKPNCYDILMCTFSIWLRSNFINKKCDF